MRTRGSTPVVALVLVAVASFSAHAQGAPAPPVRISVIDNSAEQFIAEGLAPAQAEAREYALAVKLLQDMKLQAADLSGDAQLGQLNLANADLLIIHKLTANTRKSLADNAAVLAAFVAGGGTVFQVTPADQEQQVVDWLPKPLGVMITDLDFSGVFVEDPDHPLFTTPNLLSAAEIEQICQATAAPVAPALFGVPPQGPPSPVSWESFQAFKNAKLLITNRQPGGRQPEVPAAGMLEFEYGKGRILLTSIRLFGSYVRPGSDLTKDVVTWFVDNLLNYARLVRLGQAPAVLPLVTFPW